MHAHVAAGREGVVVVGIEAEAVGDFLLLLGHDGQVAVGAAGVDANAHHAHVEEPDDDLVGAAAVVEEEANNDFPRPLKIPAALFRLR